tara:strand:- start:41 stop:337 length:297 start_codon:yes stop_codon:yes gene_type:complete
MINEQASRRQKKMSKDICEGCDKELGVIGDVDEKYKVLILNGGNLWLDFCDSCGDTLTLTRNDGVKMTYNEIYDLKPFGVNAVDSDNSPKSELKKESK